MPLVFFITKCCGNYGPWLCTSAAVGGLTASKAARGMFDLLHVLETELVQQKGLF